MATKTKPKKLTLGKGKLGYTTSNVINAPLKKVWEAATKKKHLVKHFIDFGKGEFGPKLEPVTWGWTEYGEITVQVIKYVKEKEIIMRTRNMAGTYLTTTRFEFLRKNGKTIFRVHESGYKPSDIKLAFMMCEGWSEFHCGVKAYVAWGADFRKV